MVKEYFGTLTVMFSKENSKTISLMALVFTHVQMALAMRACGLMIFNTDKVRLFGLIPQHTKGTITKAGSTVLALTDGQKATHIAASGKIIRSADLEHTNGQTADGTKAIGRITLCMDKEFTHG